MGDRGRDEANVDQQERTNELRSEGARPIEFRSMITRIDRWKIPNENNRFQRMFHLLFKDIKSARIDVASTFLSHYNRLVRQG